MIHLKGINNRLHHQPSIMPMFTGVLQQSLQVTHHHYLSTSHSCEFCITNFFTFFLTKWLDCCSTTSNANELLNLKYLKVKYATLLYHQFISIRTSQCIGFCNSQLVYCPGKKNTVADTFQELLMIWKQLK